jgi:hypothetical protein
MKQLRRHNGRRKILNVGVLLTDNSMRFPQKCALVEGEKRVIYRELDPRINRKDLQGDGI